MYMTSTFKCADISELIDYTRNFLLSQKPDVKAPT